MDSENFIQSLMLMGIGLTTVFCVLLIIIGVGNLLISFVNKFVPEEEKPKAVPSSSNAVDSNVAAAINAAILQVTNGKSKAEKIERI